jgi:3-methyladenine DNA glycosylase AlkD
MTTAVAEPVPVSPATQRARALVAERSPEAITLGTLAGELVNEPATLAATVHAGLERLADPEYHEGMHGVAPGLGPTLGVRQPLLAAVSRGLRTAMRHDRAATILDVADALLRDDILEVHWLAYDLLEQTIADEPERTWQRLRAEAAGAGDWITIDSLAQVAGHGILAEPYRWAELEQLVYSPSRWERRLVGSTIATIPHVDRRAGRDLAIVARALPILGDLIGDADPDVQKALSWALRSMTTVDHDAVLSFLQREAAIARRDDDGHRAWVVRDALDKLPPAEADELRASVAGIRKRPGAPSTSRAAATAADFRGLGVAVPPTERPIVDRS